MSAHRIYHDIDGNTLRRYADGARGELIDLEYSDQGWLPTALTEEFISATDPLISAERAEELIAEAKKGAE